jgi:hypothetical protein
MCQLYRLAASGTDWTRSLQPCRLYMLHTGLLTLTGHDPCNLVNCRGCIQGLWPWLNTIFATLSIVQAVYRAFDPDWTRSLQPCQLQKLYTGLVALTGHDPCKLVDCTGCIQGFWPWLDTILATLSIVQAVYRACGPDWTRSLQLCQLYRLATSDADWTRSLQPPHSNKDCMQFHSRTPCHLTIV